MMRGYINIFCDADAEYYNIVFDGRIINGLGKDETLAAVASLLFDAQSGPPYAKGSTLDELRAIERARGQRMAERAIPAPLEAGDLQRILDEHPEGGLDAMAAAINTYFTRHIEPELPF